jgi:proton-translocating NAD(P)+ transhydrogenase subunit alpha
MNPEDISQRASALADQAQRLSDSAQALATDTARLVIEHGQARGLDPFVFGITVLVLAVFVGYYVVWRVTPALHSPLMAVTNAISSVIIVGALIAAGPAEISAAKILGFLAVILASVNIFGGFIVTQRMLQMFRKKR